MVDIILVTYNRKNFLEKSIKEIYDKTNYRYRLWVVDNNSTDGSGDYLKRAKLHGFIHDFILLPANIGEAGGLSKGFEHINGVKGGHGEYIICTQDDLLPPKLTPCWLERLVHLMEKYPEQAGIAMRIQRTRHREINEFKDLIPSSSGLPAVFRISRTSDIKEIGGFGYAKHWEGVSFSQKMKAINKPHMSMATHIYADHIGFMPYNRGFDPEFKEYHTFSPERINQGEDQPYPEIDKDTLMPTMNNTPRDASEMKKREEYSKYWGVDFRIRTAKNLTEEQLELVKYCKKGVGLDLGCGGKKISDNAIGVDIHHESVAEIKADCRDLWMFKDDELDFIVNAHLLEHLPDTISVLREWKRALKPGGVIAIAVPDGERKPKYIEKNGHKVNLGISTLNIILKRVLGMEIIESKFVKKNNPSKMVALVAARKK